MREVLVIDVGGTHVKVSSTSQQSPLKIPSGPTMTAKLMVEQVKLATKNWQYDCVSIGYPGPVVHDRPLAEPHNLAAGWIDFPYEKTFGKPLRFINDAAMQALGGYRGGKMLFLGVGTGLGSAMIAEGLVIPLELAHLPYKKGRTYEEWVGKDGLDRLGKKRWRKSVLDIMVRLKTALICDYILLGGGNAKLMKYLPPHVILGDNGNAVIGASAYGRVRMSGWFSLRTCSLSSRCWLRPRRRRREGVPRRDNPDGGGVTSGSGVV
ncbi:MAG: ROK family protein [Edaphobacter sp.]|uniref:ROK family protein n=1 Tax=Edaphobacter sp. TaxID=1934404 RepID=UPI00238A1A49|nr:ROK family protein [Edaphobacter sp.]MDE1177211.1 ROK family protein [Edaphobacter sp.]